MEECTNIGFMREHMEELEAQTLGAFATLSKNSRGRENEIAPCPFRTAFARDRDRVIHCKSFRRLKHKTQVFLSPQGDHYRTRLTHTMEVSQIARTIARCLRLNEDLTEAIALGHDLGHTPFGHSGESVLNEMVPGGFEHNAQSLRVVEKLEFGTGLNLTFEVRDGIYNHKRCGKPITLEAAVVSLADQIAYINHDIDDAIRAGVLKDEDIPRECADALGNTHGVRINTLISDVVITSYNKPFVKMSDAVGEKFELLRDFMFENVYLNRNAKREEEKGMHVVRELYQYYLKNLSLLPEEFLKNKDEDGPQRIAADYIACMTDRYAIADYENKFVPREWI